MVVVVGDPEFNMSMTSLDNASKQFDSQEDVSVYDSNDDVSDADTIKDNKNYGDKLQENICLDATQNEKNKAYAYENDACQNDVIDEDDNASDSGVSQATTQGASSASPSTPRLERSESIPHDDAASTLPSTPTFTDRKAMTDSASTLPSDVKLSESDGKLVAMQSGTDKEFNCITMPVSC